MKIFGHIDVKILIALNTNNVDRSLIAKRMLTSMATIRLYLPGVEFLLRYLIVINKSITHISVRTDKILIYASFQQFNVQLSKFQLLNQKDFIGQTKGEKGY